MNSTLKSAESRNRHHLRLIFYPKDVLDLEFSINKNISSCPESALENLISQSTEEKEFAGTCLLRRLKQTDVYSSSD